MLKRGAKAARHRVKCTLCGESFDSDYTGKHTQKWHKNLADKGQIATTIPVGAKIVRDPWSAAAECVSTKRSRIDLDDDEEENHAPEAAMSIASTDTLQQEPEQEATDTSHSGENAENEGDPDVLISDNDGGSSESESETDSDEDPAGLSVDKESKECLGKCLYTVR